MSGIINTLLPVFHVLVKLQNTGSFITILLNHKKNLLFNDSFFKAFLQLAKVELSDPVLCTVVASMNLCMYSMAELLHTGKLDCAIQFT